jgi:pyruvate dehydrogenase E2 component (dihydrolipoyllysine-residue acetyltransferase)
MPTDVVMPQMGESIFEGTLTKWLKKAGDRVEKDEPLFEISTDKVDAEIPSPIAGVLSEIKVEEGATVGINTVVAVVMENNEEGARTPEPESAAQPTAEALTIAEHPSSQGGTDVVMPQMGESIFEGTITKWLKKAGDRVEKDEPLFEISTDKVDAEIPSPVAGVLTEIKVEEGKIVGINTVVAVIGGAAPAAVAQADGSPTTAEKPGATKTSVATPSVQAAAPAEPLPVASTERKRSSPLVRRIAKENQTDLAYVDGTGSAGRITKDNILRFLGKFGPGWRPPVPVPEPEVVEPPVAGAPAETEPTTTESSTTEPTSADAGAPIEVPVEAVPMTRMRAIIAQRMLESVQTSPHAYTVYKVDMTRIAQLRERERAAFEQTHGVKLTYMPFIAVAAVEALKKFPIVNASLANGMIQYHPHIDLGIAVALEWGLIVPVVKQAESLSFADTAKSIADLATRARAKKLKPEEASGSTFTLTNSGIFGGEYGTPIINQPESAILAIGGLKKEPVVLTDAQGNDSIAIRWMQHFCLGFDHRTIDGADSGKFMSEFKTVLESWDRAI